MNIKQLIYILTFVHLVCAAHSSHQSSAARRSLHKARSPSSLGRRVDLSLSDILGDVGINPPPSGPPDSSSSPTDSSTSPSSMTQDTTTTTTTDTDDSSSTDSSSAAASTPAPDSTSNTAPSDTTTSAPTTTSASDSSASSSSSTTSSDDCSGIVGTLLGIVGACPSSTPSSTTTSPDISSTSGTIDPPTGSGPDSPSTTSTGSASSASDSGSSSPGTTSSPTTTDPGCDPSLLEIAGITILPASCTPTSTSPSSTSTTTSDSPPPPPPPPTSSDSDSGSSSETTTTTSSPSPTTTSDPCDPGLLGIVGVSLLPASCTPTQTSSSGSGSPTDTDSSSSSTTTAPPDSCDPAVLALAGITILPSSCPPSSTEPSPPSSTEPSPPSSTDPSPTTSTSAQPTTTTTAPTDPCDAGQLGLLGITILPSSCPPSSTEPSPPSSTDPSPTTSTSAQPTTTTTAPTDPCDAGQLALMGITILPGSCTTTPVPPTSTDTGNPTTTSPPPQTTTTSIDPCDPANAVSGILPASCTTVTTSTGPPTQTVPTTIFQTGTSTDTGSATFTSSATTSINTVTETTSVTIPPFLTDTTTLLTASVPTTVLVPTNSDPDAAPTTQSIPSSQDQGGTPTVPSIPSTLPSLIFAVGAPTSQPSGTTLVSLLLGPLLNWPWVSGSTNVYSQVLTYAPIVVSNALQIPQSDVMPLALQVYVPANWDGESDNLLTLVELYIPSNQVDALAAQIKTPNSAFYTDQPAGVPSQLAGQVDGSYPLTGGDASVANPASNPDLLDPNAGGAQDDSRTRAIIGVCSAIGGALLIGLVWWAIAAARRKRETGHHRLSVNSAGAIAPQNPFTDYGAVGPEHRGRRTSFFFAEDSLRGYGNEAQHADDAMYIHRASPDMAQRGAPVAIDPRNISAPILRENTLNW